MGGIWDDYQNRVRTKNHIAYGGDVSGETRTGAFWSIVTPDAIEIVRYEDDIYYPYIRVLIWKLPAPPA